MSVGKLTTALTIIFIVSVVVLVAELLFVLWRRRSFRLYSSPPPISGADQHPDHFLTSNSYTKELLYCFCLQAQTRVEPSEAPTQKPDGSTPEESVIDVYKLFEANGRSRVLCTIKEDDREDGESTSISRDESVEVMATDQRMSLQACLESESAEIALKIEDSQTVFSSPCDSPMFFTPLGSPLQDGRD